MSFYDQFPPPSSGYRKLEQVGESLDLFITDLKVGKPNDPNDGDFPVLVGRDMRTGEEGVEFACGSAVLRRLVMELRPQAGQRVLVTFKGNQGRVKLYDMQVTDMAQPAPAPAQQFPPAEAYQQPAAAPAPAFGAPPVAPGQEPWAPQPAAPAQPAPAPWAQPPAQ